MMPYHNESSAVHPGRTGALASTAALSQTTARTAAKEHRGRMGKTTTVIDRALGTALTTEVLWGTVMSSDPSPPRQH